MNIVAQGEEIIFKFNSENKDVIKDGINRLFLKPIFDEMQEKYLEYIMSKYEEMINNNEEEIFSHFKLIIDHNNPYKKGDF